jgi:hypothetical protein
MRCYVTTAHYDRSGNSVETSIYANEEEQRLALAEICVGWGILKESDIPFHEMSHGSLFSLVHAFCQLNPAHALEIGDIQ